MSGRPTSSAASAGDDASGLVARAAAYCVKYDVHKGTHKPVLAVEAVIVDPENRSGMFATEDDICGCGDDVALAGYTDTKTTGICVQLPEDPAAKEILFRHNEKKAEVSSSHPKVFREMVVASGVGGNTLNMFLRCVRQGRKGTGVAASASGILSVEVFGRKCPIFAYR